MRIFRKLFWIPFSLSAVLYFAYYTFLKPGKWMIDAARNWKCENGKTIEQNIVDHYSERGTAPVRLDWTLNHYMQRVSCCIVYSEELSRNHARTIDEEGWNDLNLQFAPNDPPADLLQFLVLRPLLGASRPFQVHVFGCGWDAIEVCPGLEPTGSLLDEDNSNYCFRWATHGRDYAISQVPVERLNWQIRANIPKEERLPFDINNPKCQPELVYYAQSYLVSLHALREWRNAAANELFSLPELPDGVVGDLARMFKSTDEDEVWRDYCLQFLGSALERTDGVTDADRALAHETLVEALASTNATFAGTALRALHRGDPSDPLVASNALRIARDPSYPSSSRTAALLILEDCVRSTSSTASTLTETASAISSDPSASSLLRRTAEAVQKRSSAMEF